MVENKVNLKVLYESRLQCVYELQHEPKNSNKYWLQIEIHNKELMIRLFYEFIKIKSEYYDGEFSKVFDSKLEDVFVLIR